MRPLLLLRERTRIHHSVVTGIPNELLNALTVNRSYRDLLAHLNREWIWNRAATVQKAASLRVHGGG